MLMRRRSVLVPYWQGNNALEGLTARLVRACDIPFSVDDMQFRKVKNQKDSGMRRRNTVTHGGIGRDI